MISRSRSAPTAAAMSIERTTSIVRQLAHIVDGIFCYVGYLWPLWDGKRPTLADKIMFDSMRAALTRVDPISD